MKANASTSTWTAPRVESLKYLWEKGYSASQIAKEMGGGATRHSVLGKAARLGLPPRRQPNQRPSSAPVSLASVEGNPD
jgi:GcrA cell cycle regulator